MRLREVGEWGYPCADINRIAKLFRDAWQALLVMLARRLLSAGRTALAFIAAAAVRLIQYFASKAAFSDDQRRADARSCEGQGR